jgi:hypothetical protein
MVPDSRVDGNGSIELKVYHFSGVQAALSVESGDGSRSGLLGPAEDVTSCFINNLLDIRTGTVLGIFFGSISLIIGIAVLSVIIRKKTS